MRYNWKKLLEPSWVGGNLCSFIKVNETETVYTHRGSGPDFIWSGPATCLISHAITPWRKLSFRVGLWHSRGLRPIWATWPWAVRICHTMGTGMVTISWMHLDSQRPVSGKSWPIWKPGCTGTSVSEHQCCIRRYGILGIWDFIPPTRAWLCMLTSLC